MRRFIEGIAQQWRRMTMLKILGAIILGVIIADCVTFPLWSVAVGFVVTVSMAWVLRRRAMADIYVMTAAALAAMITLSVGDNIKPQLPPQSERVSIIIEDITSKRDDYLSATGYILSTERSERGDSDRPLRVRITADKASDISSSEMVEGHFLLRPFLRDGAKSYERYMARRGYVGGVNIKASQILSRQSIKPSWAMQLRQKAEQRIGLMGLSPAVESLAKGVTTGSRAEISATLRKDYTLCGTAHLLAVSGLHVGFIFVMINIILQGLALVRRGPIIRSVVTIVAIWVYAAMTGATPSVVRAAMMFSIFQLTTISSRQSHPLNRLAATASIMLLWDGRWLYDVGFLLSFISVAAIIEWGAPLTALGYRVTNLRRKAQSEEDRLRRIRSRWGWLHFIAQWAVRSLWAAFAVGVVTSIATMPLVSMMFGVVTLWSIVIGPLMILLCSIVVGAAMLQIVAGYGPLTDIIGQVVEWAGGTMNAIAAWCSSCDTLTAEWQMSMPWLILCYGVFVAATITLWGINPSFPLQEKDYRYEV